MENSGIGSQVSAVIAGVIGLAIVAVLFSQRATTASILTSAGQALSSVVGAAVAPITGSNATNTTSSGTGGVFGSSGSSGSPSSPLASLGGFNPLGSSSGGGIPFIGSSGGGGLDLGSIGQIASIASMFV